MQSFADVFNIKHMTATTAQQRYEVEWCSSIPTDENGDSIMDAAVMEVAHFPTFDKAKAFAWKLLREQAGKLPWEIARIELQERHIDADVWEHERLERVVWDGLKVWETTADGEEPYRL